MDPGKGMYWGYGQVDPVGSILLMLMITAQIVLFYIAKTPGFELFA